MGGAGGGGGGDGGGGGSMLAGGGEGRPGVAVSADDVDDGCGRFGLDGQLLAVVAVVDAVERVEAEMVDVGAVLVVARARWSVSVSVSVSVGRGCGGISKWSMDGFTAMGSLQRKKETDDGAVVDKLCGGKAGSRRREVRPAVILKRKNEYLKNRVCRTNRIRSKAKDERRSKRWK